MDAISETERMAIFEAEEMMWVPRDELSLLDIFPDLLDFKLSLMDIFPGLLDFGPPTPTSTSSSTSTPQRKSERLILKRKAQEEEQVPIKKMKELSWICGSCNFKNQDCEFCTDCFFPREPEKVYKVSTSCDMLTSCDM
jgi:hypothetical protein